MSRKCDFCGEKASVDRNVFGFTEPMAKFLQIKEETQSNYKYICNSHFDASDICSGPKRKKLKADALPFNFPNSCSIKEEHNYACLPQPMATPSGDSTEAIGPGIGESISSNDVSSSQGSNIKSSQGSTYEPTPEEIASAKEDASCGEETDEFSFKGFDFTLISMNVLIGILSVCRTPGCGALVEKDEMHITRNGCNLKIQAKCHKNCQNTFSLSEELPGESKSGRKVAVVNIMVSALILLCGLSFDPAKQFFNALKVPFISKGCHYRYLRVLLYPVIFAYWLIHQSLVLEETRKMAREAELKDEELNMAVAGDARFDSPGFRAMYATHYTVSLNTGKVLTVVVVNKRQTNNNSPAMETAATKAALEFLQASRVPVHTYATDRSSSVRVLMRDVFHWIKHQFDVWHFCRNISKALFLAAKLKSCRIIAQWHASIINMVWWSLATSIGDPEMAKEKILSILSHITGCHRFPLNHKFKQCAHGNLDSSADKEYFKEGSLALKKVRLAIMGKNGQNLDDLKFMSCFLHTGNIESLNSMTTLKYMPKAQSFSWPSMIIRSVLGAMDMNNSIDRKQQRTKGGKLMYKINADRAGHKWTVCPIKESKTYAWRDDLMELIIKHARLGQVPDVELPTDETIAIPKCPFSKTEMISKHQSRMQLKNMESLESTDTIPLNEIDDLLEEEINADVLAKENNSSERDSEIKNDVLVAGNQNDVQKAITSPYRCPLSPSLLVSPIAGHKTLLEIDQSLENDCEIGCSIDIDEILGQPERQGDTDADEFLDQLDKEIAEKQRKHEEEMEAVDKDLKAMKQDKLDRKLRMKSNAKLRNRLESELTKPLLQKMFADNLPYLQGIWEGKIESWRHNQFFLSTRTRYSLYFSMIGDPFTEEQQNWAMDEIEKIWMKSRREELDNKDYIQRVLLSEFFLKVYMDFFHVTKDEAVIKIKETPLHKCDQLKEFRGSSDSESETDT